MGGRLVSQALSLDLPTTPKFVLVAMASHADDNTGASCFPGVTLLAQETGYGQRTVRYAVARLKDLGHIAPLGENRGGRGHRAEWAITIGNPAPDAPITETKGAPDAGFVNGKGATDAGFIALNGATHAPFTREEGERVHLATLKGASGDSAFKERARVRTPENHQEEPPDIKTPQSGRNPAQAGPEPEPEEGGKQEPLPFDDHTPPEPPEWLQALQDIPGYRRDPRADRKLMAWAARKGLGDDRLEEAATDLKALLIHNRARGCWEYTDAGGHKRRYADIRATFQKWAQRERWTTNGRSRAHRGADAPGGRQQGAEGTPGWKPSAATLRMVELQRQRTERERERQRQAGGNPDLRELRGPGGDVGRPPLQAAAAYR